MTVEQEVIDLYRQGATKKEITRATGVRVREIRNILDLTFVTEARGTWDIYYCDSWLRTPLIKCEINHTKALHSYLKRVLLPH